MAGKPRDYVREERDGNLLCSSCELWLPAARFKPTKTKSSLFRHSQCNRCLYVKYTRPDQERKTKLVRDYKMNHGCSDCGYNAHPEALDFDHRPGVKKLFNIGEKVGCYSIEKIWAEIAKCDVVCRNCHAIRTAERRTPVAIQSVG